MQPALDGLLLIDKPSGPTSHDVVDRLRRALGQRRVGHSGTLDPMASGLLPLMLGRATRLVRFLPHSPKLYRGTLRLGLETDTDDLSGRELTRHSGPLPGNDAVLAAAESLVGRSLQVPPAFSARKVAGQRMYALARQGTIVDAPPSEIDVTRFDLFAQDTDGLYEFVAEVSRGTYIRGLARDLGRALGCGCALASLARTRIGPLDLSQAVAPPVDGVDEGQRIAAAVVPFERIPLEASTVRLAEDVQAARFRQGASFEIADDPGSDSPVRVLDPSGDLLGMAEFRCGVLRPRVVLSRS